MADSFYDIYFRGEILDGFQLNDVKSNVAKVFSADTEKVNSLFSGKVCLLKKKIDKQTALKYQTALKKAGAKIIIKASKDEVQELPSTNDTIDSPQSKPQSKVESATETNTQQPMEYDANLMPVGSDVLSASERKSVDTVEVDTSGISMTSVFDNPEPAPRNDPPAPNVSHISVAEVGADILPDAPEIDVEMPDISGLDIAEVGVRLTEEVIEIPLPEPDLSEMSIAEAGVRLIEEDTTPPPPAPDTSHLSIQE